MLVAAFWLFIILATVGFIISVIEGPSEAERQRMLDRYHEENDDGRLNFPPGY